MIACFSITMRSGLSSDDQSLSSTSTLFVSFGPSSQYVKDEYREISPVYISSFGG